MKDYYLLWNLRKDFFMVPLKQKIVMSSRDVTGEERFFVVAEGLMGEGKAVVRVCTTLEEAKRIAEKVEDSAVSILKQVGYGFKVE